MSLAKADGQTWVWGVLVTLTILSAWGVSQPLSPERLVVPAVMSITAIKIRLILHSFMGLGMAPKKWRLIFDVWIAVVCSAVSLCYLGVPLS
jgi:heme/copper-type cytochrome/quinol oxidase subunit 4